MKQFYVLLAALFACLSGFSQVVTTQPAIIQANTQNIVITYHADRGNKGLEGLGSSAKVYAHTGVILQGSDSWQFAPTWGDNNAKYKLTYAGSNTWTLTIPSIQSYYGLTDAQASQVRQLAFVFRTEDNSREGKTENGGDIFVNVEPEGYAAVLQYLPTKTILDKPTEVEFIVSATEPSSIKLYAYEEAGTPFASAEGKTEFTAKRLIDYVGATQIIAVVSNGKETVRQSVTFNLVGKSQQVNYPGGVPKMGTVINTDGSVIFCLAAPKKESVMIVGDWENYQPSEKSVMWYQDYEGNRYFWTIVFNINDGKDHVYYYLIDNEKAVCDPYAELVLDTYDNYIPESVYPNMPKYPSDVVSGTPVAVYNSKRGSYDWKVKNFKGVDQSALVIYELLIRDFTGTEGKANGEGTIDGVLNKLNYLKSLGVNAIELLPIMEFNGNNSWGYNTNFYFAPDKAYGTPDDYKYLIDQIHEMGMAVILDIVFNQSDGKHPWYMMYPIADNPFYNGSAPHAYSVLNDWNQDNPLVQQQFKDAVQYWINEYHVDGYRFDLVKGLGSNQSYGGTYNAANNTWSNPDLDGNTNKYNASRVARMKELHDAIREVKPDAYFINENLAGAKEENEMAEDGEINWANINHESCQFAAGKSSGANLNRFYAPLDSRTWGSTVSYAESHDEERLAYYVSKNGVSGVKGSSRSTMRRLGSVGAVMLMTPGAHMIWQFQEFGANQTTKDANGGNNTSPKTVVWSLLDKAQNAGLNQTYKELLAIRKNNPELFVKGIPTTTIACNSENWARGYYITLKSADKSLYLVVNPNTASADKISVTLNGATASEQLNLLSCSYDTTPVKNGTSVTLEPGAYAIYGSTNVVDTPSIEADDAAFRVYGANGRIAIEGNYETAEAYTMTGIAVNPDGPLAPGVYIVNVDGRTVKALVR